MATSFAVPAPFVRVPWWVLQAPDLRPTDRAVYVYLLGRAGPDATAFPSYATMATDLGLHRATVIRAVARLEQAGLLEKIARRSAHGDATSNLYRLRLWPPGSADPFSGADGTEEVRGRPTPPRGRTPRPPGRTAPLRVVAACDHPRGAVAQRHARRVRVLGPRAQSNQIQQETQIQRTTTPPASLPVRSTESAGYLLPEAPGDGTTETAADVLRELVPLVGPALARQWLAQYGVQRVRAVLRASRTCARRNRGGWIRRALEAAWPLPSDPPHGAPSGPTAIDVAADAALRQRGDADLARKRAWWQRLSSAERDRLRATLTAATLQQIGYPRVWAEAALRRCGQGDDLPGYLWLTAAYAYVHRLPPTRPAVAADRPSTTDSNSMAAADGPPEAVLGAP